MRARTRLRRSGRLGRRARVAVIGDGLWRRQFGGRPDASARPSDSTAARTRSSASRRPTCSSRGAPSSGSRSSSRRATWRRAHAARNGSPSSRALKPGIDAARGRTARWQLSPSGLAARVSDDQRRTTASGDAAAGADGARRQAGAAACCSARSASCCSSPASNVANLLLARAQARTREVAVRAALGAGRGRLIRQFLAESILLGLAGGTAGLVVACWCTRALVALGPASIPRLAEVAIDWRVLAFTIVDRRLPPACSSASCRRCAATGRRDGALRLGARARLGRPAARACAALVVASWRSRWCCWSAPACWSAAMSASAA